VKTEELCAIKSYFLHQNQKLPLFFIFFGTWREIISIKKRAYFSRMFLIVLVTVLTAVAGEPAIALTDGWKFLFAGNDSSARYASFDSTRKYEPVVVPHTFPPKYQNGPPLQGFGWYFRDLTINPPGSGNDVFLCFEGVSLHAKIFINGVFAGESGFAYVPFRINCTAFAQGGAIIKLAVMVDNRQITGRLPDPRALGWWMYGGLIRSVELRTTPKRRIDSAKVLTFHHAADTFDLSINLTSAETPWDSVRVVVSDPDGPAALFGARLTTNDTVFRIGNIRPWTPESPFRYAFTFVPWFNGVAGDTLRLLRGFCQLTAHGTGLLLNGKPYYILGMSRHDLLCKDGPLLSREERRRDLVDMKTLGVNFLRIAHFPQHRDIYELCDSLGLLVMDEIPAWKTGATFLGSVSGRDFGYRYTRSMVSAHENYTCICLWSLGNQFASYRTAAADYVSAVAGGVKKTDPSRLVTFCSYYYLWDKAFSYVDVISVNEYFGWELASLDMLAQMLDKIHKDWPAKPIFVSEFGAQSKLGLKNPKAKLAGPVKSMVTKDLSEDHHALFLRSHIDTVWDKRAYVCGMSIWSYNDYMSYLNKARTKDMPAGLNACGVVTCDREKKLSWFTVQQRFNLLRERFAEEHH
jgi:beta-galactosidase/beta-glucuronidase